MASKRNDILKIYQDLLAGKKISHNIRLLNEYVDDEDPIAYYVVGKIYEKGIKEIEPDEKKSKKYLDMAYPGLVILADRGNAEADAILRQEEIDKAAYQTGPQVDSSSYINTTGRPEDKDHLSLLREARDYINSGKKIDKALHIIRKECHNKNGYAYYMAGALLKYGIKELEVNEEKSEEYFKLAFDVLKNSNEKVAIRLLASLYRDGFGGVSQDETMSILLFEKASELGDAKASAYLAHYYEEAEHPDIAKSSFYWNLSVSQGTIGAISDVGGSPYQEGKPRDISVNPILVPVTVEKEAEPPHSVVVMTDEGEVPVVSEAAPVTEEPEEEKEEVQEVASEIETKVDDEVETITATSDALGVVHAEEIKIDVPEEETDAFAFLDEALDNPRIVEMSVEKINFIIEDTLTKTPSEIVEEEEKIDEQAIIDSVTVTSEELRDTDALMHMPQILLYGIRLLKNEDKETRESAIPVIKKAAKYGSRRALVLLGYLYEKGIVVRQNKDVALVYYNLACEHGSSNAHYRRGLMYLDKEKEVAVYNIRKAGQMGLPSAITELGNLYYQGEMGLRSPQKAYEFYREAAKRDYPIAFYNLAIIEERNGNHDLAIQYKKKASELGFEYER